MVLVSSRLGLGLGLVSTWSWSCLGLDTLWSWSCLGLGLGGLDYKSRSDVQRMRNEIANSMAATRVEFDGIKVTVKETEDGLSMWTSEVTTLQSTVESI